jgi:spore germination cell wall hydrolase CwlJ-like protein
MKLRKYLGAIVISCLIAATPVMAAEVPTEVTTELETAHFDETDLRYMTSIIFAEAGNQCIAGQQAVGIVVMNRINSTEFRNSVYDVIYEKGQFSPVKNGALNKALKKYDNGELPESCIEAAKYALEGNTSVSYNGTIYEMSNYLYFSRRVKGCKLQIQDHQFK